MEIKEWLENEVTRALIKRIESDRMYALEAILMTDNKDDACGLVKGITNVLNLITNLEEGDLGGD